MGIKRSPIFKALNRSPLIAGGEREPMLFVGLIAMTMIFVAMSWQSAIIGVVIWVVFSWILRKMAKADPLMTKVYTRHIKYKPFYPAQSTPFSDKKRKK